MIRSHSMRFIRIPAMFSNIASGSSFAAMADSTSLLSFSQESSCLRSVISEDAPSRRRRPSAPANGFLTVCR